MMCGVVLVVCGIFVIGGVRGEADVLLRGGRRRVAKEE